MVNIARFSLVTLIVLLVATAPLKVKAQDNGSTDEDSFTPPPAVNNNPSPPVILDEGDSGSVSDVEEYDN